MWTGEIDEDVDSSVHVLPVHKRSPPLSTNIVEDEGMDRPFAQHQQYQPYTTRIWPSNIDGNDGSSPMLGFPKCQLTPQPWPVIETSNNVDPVGHIGTAYPSPMSMVTLSASTPSSSFRIPITTLDPTDSMNLEFTSSCSCTLDFPSTRTAGWCNHDLMPTAQAIYPTYHESSIPTTPQNMLVSMVGIGMEMPSSSDITEYPSQPEMQSYCPAMYPILSEDVDASSVASISIHPPSRLSSPRFQPHFHCRRPSCKAQCISIAQSRRKSSISSYGSSSTPSGESVGFVNFTPGDRRKILAGVAPSGSSKTKVRREKEAVERRRKLSQAAVKTVEKACEDVNRLRTLERKELHD